MFKTERKKKGRENTYAQLTQFTTTQNTAGFGCNNGNSAVTTNRANKKKHKTEIHTHRNKKKYDNTLSSYLPLDTLV